MLGIIYLFLAGMLGYETSKILTEEGRSILEKVKEFSKNLCMYI